MTFLHAGTLRNVYGVGAIAAIIAALVFRRNLGAEIILFAGQSSPTTADGWFILLQNNSLLGLGLLNIFDIVNYLLVGMMFISVYYVLRRTCKRYAAIALALGLIGIGVYLIFNTAFSMLSLSSHYANATTEADKSSLLSAGQALLSKGDPGAVYQGIGGYISLALLALAGLITSAIMFWGRKFGRITASVGVTASVLDLSYIVGLAFAPAVDVYVLSAFCLGSAGLLLMVWHLLVGVKLYQLSKTSEDNGGGKQ